MYVFLIVTVPRDRITSRSIIKLGYKKIDSKIQVSSESISFEIETKVGMKDMYAYTNC